MSDGLSEIAFEEDAVGKPRLLDLFCGAGGAAVGYHRTGFQVVGVDIKPQPRYPYEFIQVDALDFLRQLVAELGTGPMTALPITGGFDAIHASPPCQAYTVANNIWQREHPDLLPETRRLLRETGLPYVIENVPGAPMENPVTVCGSFFPELNVKRHRWFEANFPLTGTFCMKGHPGDWLLIFGHTVLERGHVIRKTAGHNTTRRKHTTTERGREAMGIDWMNRDELSEAIPPAYTEFIGKQLLEQVRQEVAA